MLSSATDHPFVHLVWTLGLLVLGLSVWLAVRNRTVRRRLVLVEVLLVAALAVHAAVLRAAPGTLLHSHGQEIENFLVSFALITAVVALAFNPWLRERAGDGTPAIVQDTLVAVLTVVAAMFVFQNASFLLGITGSAIVVGLALQDTLGNAFAGLAIQIEKPFRVGHWVLAAGHEGRVVEVTWRATKLRTKAGNLVVLPNSTIAKEAINNYSEPAAPTRLLVEVGASYLTPPNETREALLAAARRVPRVLARPEPEVLVLEFAASAITYRLYFWIDDFECDETTQSDVRAAIYYEFRRRQIEIPWPIQVEYSGELPVIDRDRRRASHLDAIAAVPVFSGLPEDARAALADAAVERLYAAGEVIVTEGSTGQSMFLVERGEVAVTVGPDARQVALTPAGGYFGEMSLLTGDPRTATVTARVDTTVLEIAADDFRVYVRSRPEVIDDLAAAAERRRRELDQTRALPPAGTGAHALTLAQRMRKFFGLA